MLDRIFGYLFTKTKLGKLIDGKKTFFVGAVNIAYFLLEVANIATRFFPSIPQITYIGLALSQFLDVARPYLATIGITTSTVVMIENKRKVETK